jgi:hypothetical protein
LGEILPSIPHDADVHASRPNHNISIQPTFKMAEEVYDGAIGIDLGK